MKTVYKTKIKDKLDDAIFDAKAHNLTIQHFELTREELEELLQITNPLVLSAIIHKVHNLTYRGVPVHVTNTDRESNNVRREWRDSLYREA